MPDPTNNKLCKFGTNTLEVSDDVREICNISNQIKKRFKYIFENGTITINASEEDTSARQAHEKNIQVTFKIRAPLNA